MSVESLINRHYERLAMTQDDIDLVTQTGPMTARISYRDIHMTQALADFFGMSRSAFAADLLEQAIFEAFTHLSPEDRQALAEKADKAFQGSQGYWSNQANALQCRDDQRKSEEVSADLGLAL